MARLKGQVALVTGAAVGLGRQYAESLARSGCDLVICDVRPEVARAEEELGRLGVRAVGHVADVSLPADVRRVVDSALRDFGRIDILISNAGVWRGGGAKDSLDKSLKDYDVLIGTNLKGVFLFGRAVIPHMIAAGASPAFFPRGRC